MLNIPNHIIALCKADSTRKNFRVHFPNGENADLTNADIVAGTVQFTESVSSKDVLQFGLAEASRIQFECVNVQNIYGMTIECGIEIDTSSLTPADITSIQSNQGDGTLVLESASDIGYGYYHIPYGVFTVTSCPRSAGAMWRRRVEAYSDIKQGESFIQDSLAFRSGANSLDINLFSLAVGISNSNMGILQDDSTITLSQTANGYGSSSWTIGADFYSFEFVSADVYEVTNPTYLICRMTCEYDTTGMDQVYEDMKSYGASDANVSMAMAMIQPSYTFSILGNPPEYHAFKNTNDSGYMPYFSVYNVRFVVPLNLTMQIAKNGTAIETYTFSNLVSNLSFKSYTLSSSDLLKVNASFTPSYENSLGRKSYIDTAQAMDIYNGALEILGLFGRCGRTGNNEYVTLSKSSPIAMSTNEYMELWWDEYDISPVGSVQMTYKDIDLNAEQTIIYNFGGGLSSYDMTNNYILKNLAVSVNDLSNQTVEEFVTGLINAYFIPNIADIAFTPVQLDALGLPYLEAGDYLEIDDGNNGTVGTYILNRTISGEQFLQDDITATGGEIIGNVRSV